LEKRIQNQQIEIAGDEHIRATVNGQFQKFVIGWITTRDDPLGDRHQFRFGKYPPYTINERLQYSRYEIRPLRNFEHLASVTVLLRSSPYLSSQRTSSPGQDDSFNAALKSCDVLSR
jgi:hypothetical protein